MNIDIKENIINNIKFENTDSLIAIIDESAISNDELVYPGMGVILSLFWNSLNKDEKIKIANTILKKIKSINL